MTDLIVFSVQDETGTVAQLTVAETSPALDISVGDTGLYAGIPDDGQVDVQPFATLPFTVSSVTNDRQFSVATRNANMADWPADGLITWVTGVNVGATSEVQSIDGANAYIDPTFLTMYHQSRGNAVPPSATTDAMRAAIVKSTDYLDGKYRFAGVKLLTTLGSFAIGEGLSYEPWAFPFGFGSANYLTPSTSTQTTEWPRQGVIDTSGNTVRGIPKAIKQATAELAIRVLNGIVLQPDYDATLVQGGAVVSSISKEVGPLKTSITYDVSQGLGFFASIPQVDRMLSKSGLLASGGGRTLIR